MLGSRSVGSGSTSALGAFRGFADTGAFIAVLAFDTFGVDRRGAAPDPDLSGVGVEVVVPAASGLGSVLSTGFIRFLWLRFIRGLREPH